ncbi:MAG: peptidase, partial [Gemmatimonadaceae bacterium]
WRMGMNSIERGKRDHWTISDQDVQELRVAVAKADSARRGADGPQQAGSTAAAEMALYTRVMKDPAERDPRAYVLPASQSDFPTAVKFVNALRHAGITVERATRAFSIGNKQYPAGSFVIPMSQAFRAHVLDMFEPQDHPNDFAYPGGPPIRPYDSAGWTLAYQMGLQFDRILDGYTCPCERVTGLASPPAGTMANANAPGFMLSPRQNDAFEAVSRLLESGANVSRLTAPVSASGRTYQAGTFFVNGGGSVTQALQSAARDLGISVEGVSTRPSALARITAPRIALWDTYGGSMPSGWTRWILEQYGFPFDVVYTSTLDAGNLRSKYDVIVLVDGAVQTGGGRGFGRGGQQRQPPEEFRHMVGRVTQERTAPQLRRFLEEGGQVITIGSSTVLAEWLDLPLSNALVERLPTGEERELPADKFYVPGSLLRVAVDSTAAVAAGSPGHVDVMFDNSPVFRLAPDAIQRGVRPIAWFDSATPLRSGWAWGQTYLEGGVAMAEARVGRGKLYVFGPEILFRAQPHGTFRFFFNALLDANRSPSPLTP